jgi:uncharacterized protein YcfL
MKNILYLSAILFLVLSCSSETFHYTNECSSADFFKIDSCSQVYARKLYLTQNSTKTADSISDSNKKQQQNRLIEVQYLIINPDKEVLYITTRPTTKIYDKSADYQLRSAKNSYPNSYVFNTFYFGKLLDGDKDGSRHIVFKDNRNSQVWNLKKANKGDSIILLTIDNYRIKHVKTAIAVMKNNAETIKDTFLHNPVYRSTENVGLSANHGVEFIKIPRFHYLSFDDPNLPNRTATDSSIKRYAIYSRECLKKDIVSKRNLYPKANRIYFKYSGTKLQYIFIPFDMDITKSSHGIKFNCSWVKFEPNPERRPKKS